MSSVYSHRPPLYFLTVALPARYKSLSWNLAGQEVIRNDRRASKRVSGSARELCQPADEELSLPVVSGHSQGSLESVAGFFGTADTAE